MIFSQIPANQIIHHIEKVKELMDRLGDLFAPRATPGDIVSACVCGDLTLWGAFDEELIGKEEPLVAILVTNVRPYYRCNVLEILVLAGDRMPEWLDKMNEVTTRYAKSTNCALREIPAGRKGWLRALKKYGFEESPLTALECKVG